MTVAASVIIVFFSFSVEKSTLRDSCGECGVHVTEIVKKDKNSQCHSSDFYHKVMFLEFLRSLPKTTDTVPILPRTLCGLKLSSKFQACCAVLCRITKVDRRKSADQQAKRKRIRSLLPPSAGHDSKSMKLVSGTNFSTVALFLVVFPQSHFGQFLQAAQTNPSRRALLQELVIFRCRVGAFCLCYFVFQCVQDGSRQLKSSGIHPVVGLVQGALSGHLGVTKPDRKVSLLAG